MRSIRLFRNFIEQDFRFLAPFRSANIKRDWETGKKFNNGKFSELFIKYTKMLITKNNPNSDSSAKDLLLLLSIVQCQFSSIVWISYMQSITFRSFLKLSVLSKMFHSHNIRDNRILKWRKIDCLFLLSRLPVSISIEWTFSWASNAFFLFFSVPECAGNDCVATFIGVVVFCCCCFP